MKKVVLGMSGGVDSSVSAYLLKEEGYEVIGVTLALIDEKHSCRAKNIEDAKAVCDKLGIEFKLLHFEDIFEKEVIEYFIEEYKQGRTPNPCVMCNKKIKFGKLMEVAEEMGADYLATGHYALIEKDEKTGRYTLSKADDDNKDQSYFLYNLTQEQLSKTLMPLSGYKKEEVRKIAEKLDLVVAKKKDSEDICFIPDNDPQEFINSRIGENTTPGEFIDINGNVLGQHKGISNYTLGQRRGLGIALGKRVFVKDIIPEKNQVVIAEDKDLYKSKLWAKDVNFITIDKLEAPMEVEAKIRYSKNVAPAIIKPGRENMIEVEFLSPQRAITKGQSVVFYKGNTVVGGGIIEDVGE